MACWAAMEALYDRGLVTHLGISNVSAAQLPALLEAVRIKPSFVQNRCYAVTQWDFELRQLCTKHAIGYQAFSLLTANPQALYRLAELAQKYDKTAAQVIFRFTQQKGMIPLTGNSSIAHMQADLSLEFTLSPSELVLIETIGL